MTILIVEDEPFVSRYIQKVLEIEGFQTVVAQNGREGLDVLERDSGVQVVVVDIMMPEMDGLSMIRQMKAVPRTEDLGVVICSAIANDHDVQHSSMELGVWAFVSKPIHRAALIREVHQALRFRRQPRQRRGTSAKRRAA